MFRFSTVLLKGILMSANSRKFASNSFLIFRILKVLLELGTKSLFNFDFINKQPGFIIFAFVPIRADSCILCFYFYKSGLLIY